MPYDIRLEQATSRPLAVVRRRAAQLEPAGIRSFTGMMRSTWKSASN